MRERLADLVAVDAVDAELADRAGGALGRSLSWPASGFVSFFAASRAELDGRVAVAILGPQPGHGIRFDGQDADGNHRAVGLEHLRHTDLAADQSDTHGSPITS